MLLKIFGYKYYLFTYIPFFNRGEYLQCIVSAKDEATAVQKFINKRLNIGAYTYESVKEIELY